MRGRATGSTKYQGEKILSAGPAHVLNVSSLHFLFSFEEFCAFSDELPGWFAIGNLIAFFVTLPTEPFSLLNFFIPLSYFFHNFSVTNITSPIRKDVNFFSGRFSVEWNILILILQSIKL